MAFLAVCEFSSIWKWELFFQRKKCPNVHFRWYFFGQHRFVFHETWFWFICISHICSCSILVTTIVISDFFFSVAWSAFCLLIQLNICFCIQWIKWMFFFAHVIVLIFICKPKQFANKPFQLMRWLSVTECVCVRKMVVLWISKKLCHIIHKLLASFVFVVHRNCSGCLNGCKNVSCERKSLSEYNKSDYIKPTIMNKMLFKNRPKSCLHANV